MRILILVIFLGGCSMDKRDLRLGVWKTGSEWQCVEKEQPYRNRDC
jgi:hypothetical protein